MVQKSFKEIASADEKVMVETREWIIQRLKLFKEIYNLEYTNQDYMEDYFYDLDYNFGFQAMVNGPWLYFKPYEYNMSVEELAEYLKKKKEEGKLTNIDRNRKTEEEILSEKDKEIQHLKLKIEKWKKAHDEMEKELAEVTEFNEDLQAERNAYYDEAQKYKQKYLDEKYETV